MPRRWFTPVMMRRPLLPKHSHRRQVQRVGEGAVNHQDTTLFKCWLFRSLWSRGVLVSWWVPDYRDEEHGPGSTVV